VKPYMAADSTMALVTSIAAVSQVVALLRADPNMCREDAYRQVGEAVGRPGNTARSRGYCEPERDNPPAASRATGRHPRLLA
jgi:hypothetical protein